VFTFLSRRWEGGVFAAIRNRSLFRRESPALSRAETIQWWESRRVPYNLIVGIFGICTSVAVFAIGLIANVFFHGHFERPDPPIFLIVSFYGIMANICFTCGWVVELMVRRLSPRKAGGFAEKSFFCGLVFSVVLTLSPAVLVGFFFIHRPTG
jgi:hypothetical protein